MAKPKIEGTQRPTNIAAFSSPLNHNISENTRDKKAETSIKKSLVVSFLSIRSVVEIMK